MKTCNARSCWTSQIWGAGSRRAGWGGYTLRVVREVRWVFSRHLKVSKVFDSLIAAGNSFQIVGAEKLTERLPKLIVQKGIDRRFWLAERRHRKGWYVWRRFLRYCGWFVDRLLYVKRAILYCWMYCCCCFSQSIQLVMRRVLVSTVTLIVVLWLCNISFKQWVLNSLVSCSFVVLVKLLILDAREQRGG